MPTSLPCPACHAETARLLIGASTDAYVWYYRCPRCGHAWSVSKSDANDVGDVMPLPPKDALPR